MGEKEKEIVIVQRICKDQGRGDGGGKKKGEKKKKPNGRKERKKKWTSPAWGKTLVR